MNLMSRRSVAFIVSSLMGCLGGGTAIAQSSPISGQGTTNAVPLFTGTYTIGNSNITQSNGNVGIGTTSPSYPLQIGTPNTASGIFIVPSAGWAAGDNVAVYLGGTNHYIQGNYSSADVISGYYGAQFKDNSGTVMTVGYNGGGNVGIGTTSPAYTLDVSGPIRSSTGGFVFPDGSTQATAFNNSGTATIKAGEIVFPDNSSLTSAASMGLPAGVVLNQTFVFGIGAVHTFLIATLPASTAATYDHLHLLVTLNAGDSSYQTSYVDATFGNRNRFTGLWSLRGSPVAPQSKLVAYENTDGSVGIYMVLGSQYVSGGYTILEAEQEQVYSNPPDLGAYSFSGQTVLFDSSTGSNPPAVYTDFSGNTTFQGNVTLSQGSGASIKFPDGTVQSTAYTGTCSTGGDYAESVDVTGPKISLEPGDIIVIDPEHPGNFLKSTTAYSPLVAGIYSTKPGYVGRRQKTDPRLAKGEIPMAMVGIVPTKVNADNGPIKVGDLLVTSSTPGYAMHGTNPAELTGAVVGKALGKLSSGSGVIEVLVSLQ
jgi:hypothetical protein